MGIVDNILSECKERGISVSALEKSTGLGNGTIKRWATSSPTVDRLEKIADYLGVSIDYLLERDTLHPVLSPSDRTLLRDYKQLDAFGRDYVLYVIQRELERIKLAEEQERPTLVPLSRSLQPASAGRGTYLGAEEMEIVFVEDNPITRQANFIVPVSGNSMEPLYHDGDQLLIERAEDIEIGEIGVFTVDGDGYVKRRGDGVLMSLNPAFPDVPLSDNSWCNGRVIGVLKQSDLK